MKTLAPNLSGLRVLTPDGYQEFAGVALMGTLPIWRVAFGNRRALECTADHKLFTTKGMLPLSSLQVGDWVWAKDGRRTVIKSITQTDRSEPVYDLIEVGGGHRYYTNGILSSNCQFVTDDDTLINPLTLNTLKPKNPAFYTGTVRWYVEPEPNRTYLIALDPALGTKNDYSAIQIFQIPEMVQVGEWQNNTLDPRRVVAVLMETMYALEGMLRENPAQQGDPEIYWTFENNSIGEAVLIVVEDTGEERFPGTLVTERRRKGLNMKRVRKGLHTSPRSRLSSLARMKSLIESGRMTLHSAQLIRELKNFVASGNNIFKAKPGEHDDLVMATSLVVRMIDVVLSWDMQTDGSLLREYIDDSEFEDLLEEPMPVII